VTRIAIIGAGIGGLVAALALQRAGFRPRIYERAAAFSEVGAGLSISPNAVKGLESLGLGDFLQRIANEPLDQHILHGTTGEMLMSIDRRTCRETYGAAYYQVHRADLHSELVARVGANAISGDHQLVGIDSTPSHVKLSFAGRDSVDANVVIAADGLRSVVREALFDPQPARFSGHVAWRGLVDARQLPERYTARSTINHIGPGRNLVTYPVRSTALVNIVALTRSAAWAEESWTAKAPKAELQALFSDWTEHVRAAIAAMPEDDIYRWGLFLRQPLDNWVHQRVGLLGDAAHPMLPYMGQGASCAIEDGVVLGRCFAASGDALEALRLYNHARVARGAMLQVESNQGGDRLQALDPYVLRDSPPRNEDALGIFAYDPARVEIGAG
jgi:salicylate hydroxylase